MQLDKKTINEKEIEIQNFWKEKNIFKKSVDMPAGEKPRSAYSFYDGPPFATGTPHHGHILAGTIKDTIPRYHTMNGKSVRRVWGWDCHGLPIENLVEKEIGLNSKKDIEDYGVDKFNAAAASSVLRYENEWKKIIPRLGRWADMDHPYKTMDATYTESVWWVWKTLFDKGLAYEGSKMMHICPRCETPLAQSEVGLEYHDLTDISVTVQFELVSEPNTFVLAWTTTPWTLPGNTALAVNKSLQYVKVKLVDSESFYIVAKSLVEKVFKGKEVESVIDINTQDLIGKSYYPIFPYFKDKDIDNKENIWKIWHADFITDESGTGIAHEAPAFGAEDMELAKANNIPVIKHVKMNGQFIEEVTDFAGMVVKKKGDSQSADIEIIKWLAHNGKLFSKEKIVHSYPLCWRCATPLLNYATSSWFVDVPKIKDKLIGENLKIKWVPEHIRDGRFGKWLEGAREWAVSRSRYWGAPLPVWRSVDGVETKVVGSLEEIAREAKNNYFVMRHGETVSNVNMVIDSLGDPNNHLTEKGKAQVLDTKKEIDKLSIDLIISSPFLRTKETAELVAGPTKVEFDDRLREIDFGGYDGKKLDQYIDDLGIDYLKLDTRISTGETHREVMNRVMSLMEELETKHENKNILIVTHGGPMRMMICGAGLITEEQLIQDELEHDPKLYPKNAELRKVDYKVVPRDETGAINLHKPYIDKTILKDSRGVDMKIIGDVFDCWFESGSMPYGQLHYPFENKKVFEENFPAEFIAEGLDQTRGWFYSLINLGVGLFEKAPYKHVIVNGLVMAEDGSKMSKSQKNYTDPLALVEKFGADALRYALLASPLVKGENTPFGDSLVEEVYKKNIQRLENVVEFYKMYSDLPHEASRSSKNILDIWMISNLSNRVMESTHGYESYKLDEAVNPITPLIDDLSTWYLRRSRERLKGDMGQDAKIEALSTLKYVLIETAKLVAPVMPFLAERVYMEVGGQAESVHLDRWTVFASGDVNTSVLDEMQKVRSLVSDALMLRQKSNIKVRQPLQSLGVNFKLESQYEDIVKDEVNVKEIIHSDTLSLDTNITEELRVEGQKRDLSREIKDKRKELGLASKDEIVLFIDADRYSLADEEYKKEMKIRDVQVGSELQVKKA